jgi:tetratricopeptide (TPR) repeat protein
LKRKALNIIIAAALFVGLLFSCSTEKNTALRRGYHNLTAYFNALYNARDAYRTAEKRLLEDPGDNYAQMLNIFYYSNNGAATKVANDMGRVQEKTSKVIKRHSITARPEKRKKNDRDFNSLPEYNKFVDDAFLLKGIAELYKHEFYPAIETFLYIIKEYSMFPVKYDGQLWLARTYLEMNNLKAAEPLIDQMDGDNQFPERLKRDLYLTQAQFHKKQYQFEQAAQYLVKAIPLTKKKTYKYRYHFILAQLYQEMDDNDRANENYAIVMKKNPIYEMVFNARINMAQLYRSSQGSATELKEELKKMLEDEKNKEFRDQIYFALASIERGEGNIDQALAYYRKSAAVSVQNNYQKTESYLAVADIYFGRPDYRNAQLYYDSAVSFIDKKRRNYDEIYNKTKNLTELVKFITVIEHQDSLQRVAAMPESQRLAMIDKIIKDLVEEEKRQQEEERMARIDALNARQNNTRVNTGSSWYFYNPTAVSMGESTFKQKWGARKLEDHWRRKNKAQIDDGMLAESEQPEDSTRITDNKKREYYLQDLPISDSAIAVSDSLIKNAYSELANVYRIKMEDLPKAVETYEELLKRFPDYDKKLTVYYNLYKINQERMNSIEETKYKNIIINQYPNSVYAQIMMNPEYVEKLLEEERQARFFYQTTWRLFRRGEYQQVKQNFVQADTAYSDTDLYPKFALLNTIAKGQTSDSASFVGYLNQYIKQFPDAEEKAFANDLLRYMTSDQEEPQGVEKKEEVGIAEQGAEDEIQVDFELADNEPHYYVAIIDTRETSANKVAFDLGNFNIDYYSMLTFNVKSAVYSANYQIVMVSPFTAWYNAMNYYESIEYINEVYQGISDDHYIDFAISKANFTKLMETKATAQYLKFFMKNYIERREESDD